MTNTGIRAAGLVPISSKISAASIVSDVRYRVFLPLSQAPNVPSPSVFVPPTCTSRPSFLGFR